MSDRRIDVQVNVPPELRLGAFANAFRVSNDGGDVFLDFVLYSEQEHAAALVCRVRVHPTFVLDMHNRLAQAIAEYKIIAVAQQAPQEEGLAGPLNELEITPDKVN